MKLSIVGSSSKGNGYVLHNDTEALIIEAGVKYKSVKQAIDWNVSKIAACIVSHSHSDHAGHMDEYLKEGVKVYAPASKEQSSHNYHFKYTQLEFGVQFHAGSFHILPFSLVHDVPCAGYLIKHPEAGKLVFITDTHYCPYKFTGVNHFIIEANYSEAILRHRLDVGLIDFAYYERVIRSHMSLETAIAMLSDNDLTHTHTITLIHLSDGNSDARLFKRTVEKTFGIPVTIADAGMVIELHNPNN